MKHVAMIHSNFARVTDGVFKVDRKFHVGMSDYAAKIKAPLLTVHPEGDATMDVIEVPVKDLPYRVQIGDPRSAIAGSALMYGSGMGSVSIARQMGIPYIPILEYDRQTQFISSATQVSSRLRRLSRYAKVTLDYWRRQVAEMRGAHSIHCNGYPIYEVAQRYNRDCLLYLDSRMSADQVISEQELEARLAKRKAPLRLLYTGRYEPMKGALDAVRVAFHCLKRGIKVEMHTFGQGSQMAEMERLAKGKPIYIHGPMPYPELVKVSRTFDAFVCCHIQSDPSCTYLESMGAGLPIFGYANRMWERMQRNSMAGWAFPVGDVEAMGDGIIMSDGFTEASREARRFALEHCYEEESGKRIAALNQIIATLGSAEAA